MENLCRDSEVTTITPPGLGAVVVSELPAAGKTGIVYVVDSEPVSAYIWNGSAFVPICEDGGGGEGDI